MDEPRIISVDEGHGTLNKDRICPVCGNHGTILTDSGHEICGDIDCKYNDPTL